MYPLVLAKYHGQDTSHLEETDCDDGAAFLKVFTAKNGYFKC